MNGLWVIGGLVGLWLILKLAGRPLVALIAGKAIGAKALARQPDTIALTRRDDSAWTDATAAGALWRPLVGRGFADAGTYTIDELQGVVVKLLVHSGDGVIACAYEHSRAGRWVELVTRFQDGTSFSVTGIQPHGLDPRPGHKIVNLPGVEPVRLFERLIAERPSSAIRSVTVAEAPRSFEQAYAESIAWRKQQGISTREVAKVAMRKAA